MRRTSVMIRMMDWGWFCDVIRWITTGISALMISFIRLNGFLNSPRLKANNHHINSMKWDCTNLYNQSNTLRLIIAFYSLILWTWWRNHKSEPAACRHLRRSQCGRPNPHLSVDEMHVPWPAWSTPWSWPQNLLHMATLLNQIISFRY